MTDKHIVFSHGKDGEPWGSKISAMDEYIKKKHSNYQTHSLDYQAIKNPDERADKLIEYLNTLNGEIILVGSSMGGYVSTKASSKVENSASIKGLLLLAPAFYLEGYAEQNPLTSCKIVKIIHGWNDTVVPFKNSVSFAFEHKASLKLVDDNHPLSGSMEDIIKELDEVINAVL